MKNRHSYIFLLLLFSLFPLTVSADSLDTAAREILEKFGRNVFAVNAYTKQEYKKNENGEICSYRYQNVGTAFSLNNDGHLITLNCIIKNAEEVKVISRTGEKIKARVLGCDKEGSVNVLQIERIHASSIPQIISSNDVNPGKKVVLLGIVKGKGLTANTGVISNIVPIDGTFIVDVNGNPGTSGTTVFDKNGHVLGFLTYQIEKNEDEQYRTSLESGSSRSHYYVVLPIRYASAIASSIINRDKGNCGWLGIYSNFNNNPPDKDGVIIHKVVEDSPAQKCGLEINDRIIEFNGVTISSLLQLIETVTDTRAGDTVPIKVRRGGKILSFDVTLSTYQISDR